VDTSLEPVREGLFFLVALILSISVHEFGHAWAATRLGDPLPRSQGRLTLSPLRHIDPIGTLLFPIVAFWSHVPLFGWGRPVQTDPHNYTRRLSRNTGHMLVALAGPAMNLLLAVVVSLLLVIAVRVAGLSRQLAIDLFRRAVVLNLTLMFINLLPIPPLDGGAVLAWVLPRSMQHVVDFLSRWGFLILLGLLMVPAVFGTLMVPLKLLTTVWGVALQEAYGP
jgi:Zn-dependent protease